MSTVQKILEALVRLKKQREERAPRLVPAAAKRPKKPRRRRAVMRFPVRLHEQLAAAMVAGRWYARPDLARLIGANRKGIDMIVVRMRNAGLLEQGEDPTWEPEAYPKGIGVHIAARRRRPRYLFRLTEEGRALGRVAAMLT